MLLTFTREEIEQTPTWVLANLALAKYQRGLHKVDSMNLVRTSESAESSEQWFALDDEAG